MQQGPVNLKRIGVKLQEELRGQNNYSLYTLTNSALFCEGEIII